MNTFTVTVREAARNQKKIFEKVKKTKRPALVVSKSKGPQVAIVPLEDLEELEKIKIQKSAAILLKLKDLAEEFNTEGPKTNAVEDTKTLWD